MRNLIQNLNMINGLNLYRERIIDYEKRILRTAILSTILLSACSINFGADNKNDRDNDIT